MFIWSVYVYEVRRLYRNHNLVFLIFIMAIYFHIKLMKVYMLRKMSSLCAVGVRYCSVCHTLVCGPFVLIDVLLATFMFEHFERLYIVNVPLEARLFTLEI